MKFLHTSDLHIGKMVCGFSMLDEQVNSLQQIADIAVREQVDAVFLCGDLYDRALPASQAVVVFDQFLTGLIESGVQVFGIAGNHDSGERIAYVRQILKRQGLHLEGVLEGEVPFVDWEKEGETVRVHLLPYAKPVQVQALYGVAVRDYEAAMQEILKHVRYLEDGRNILLAHQFVVSGGQEPELSDSETRVSVGTVDCVEVSNFDRFDYVALGHIHRSQQSGGKPVYYSGSPVKYSFSEANHQKSVMLGSWNEGGELILRKEPLTAIHDLRIIRGRLADLISDEVSGAAPADDYIMAVLTNEEELADPIGTLRSVYPNIMQLKIERISRQSAGERSRVSMKERSPFELFSEFYETVMAEELTPDQQALVVQVIETAKEELT